ncbi:MAG TPA: redoxin domain-containing protein [Smithellaceae bacterium]|nr:redoxin domain-containing protein [Smithellaceae bacterium]HRS82917.1 redoxin domain-containing protein [Smithellaceae bacterium]HRV45299.1 redoxin domain-containing protein [Smithellaceae bacterium]
MKRKIAGALLILGLFAAPAFALSDAYKENIFTVGKLKPVDSVLKVKIGRAAPGFTLRAVSGRKVSLADYRGKKNVVLSFVPAAWTPVCSDQWPGYNVVQELFEENNAVLLGISVDNIPTLYSWTHQMGRLWFDVLSDFWPHGAVASRYGILRSDGTAERAIIIIDQKGIIRYIDVHDINERPPLESIILQLEKLRK